MKETMRRREFVWGLALGFGGGLCLSLPACSPSSPTLLPVDLSALLPKASLRIGKTILDKRSFWDSSIPRLEDVFPPSVLWAQMSAKEVLERLRTQIAADFESGRTVSVGGWVLAETEARLCVFHSLLRVGEVSLIAAPR
jgi:hypothetical protein